MIITPIDIPNIEVRESLDKDELLAKCKNTLGENLFLEFEYCNGMIDDKEYITIRPLHFKMFYREKGGR